MASPAEPAARAHAVSRREALRSGVALLGCAVAHSMDSRSAPAAEPEGRASAAPALGAIDAHSHVWTSDVQRYPLAAGFAPSDMQPASFTPRELLAAAEPCGVARVVLIQMSYYGFDNRYMLDAMRDHPGKFSGVAVIDHHAADVLRTMRDLRARGVRGLRIHPAAETPAAWLAHADMAALWKHGADEQVAMCALINPEALAPLDAMCEKFPRTTLVVDHFARIGVDGTIRDDDVERLCRLARHPRTYVKVSAFYALGKKQSPYTDLGPMIRRLLAAFGARRLMWATDCPYQVQSPHVYCDSIELVRSRLAFLSDEDRQWMLRKTAEAVFFG